MAEALEGIRAFIENRVREGFESTYEIGETVAVGFDGSIVPLTQLDGHQEIGGIR
jgi:hypothetical protein